MNFKSTVMPGVRAFASTMRVKLFCDRTVQVRTPFSIHSSPAKVLPRANWRICPTTGQLQQRWGIDDSQDPQSRSIARLFQQAMLMLGLYVGTRAFS